MTSAKVVLFVEKNHYTEFYVREAIERYLEELGDLYLAEMAYSEYLKDTSKTKK